MLTRILNMKWIGYVCICHVFVMKCLAMTVSELEDFGNFLEQTSRLDQNVKSNVPHDELDDDEPISDHAWEASGKFEGDLILNEKQRKMILTNVAVGLARNGVTDSTKRWPNNEVIYFVQPEHFNLDQMEAIQKGIDDLARVSCIKFRPYVKGDRDAVVIQGSRRGCFSQVGYQGGYQVLNLSRRHPAGRGCFRHGTVVHELLHTLGFYHMQSSPDRDDYIDVLYENIIKPARHNFRKYSSFAVTDFGVGYDYESVLHYSRKAFSSNGQDTIIPKQLGAVIGQRIGLSEKDVQKLNKMYCDADTDLLLEDSSNTPKKLEKLESDKNKPFVGYGLGYEKGKLIIIKLPRPEKRKMPQFPIFDYFSKTTEELPPAFIEGVGDKKEMNETPVSSYDEEYSKPTIVAAFPQVHYDNKVLPFNTEEANVDEGVSSDTHEEDLTEALRVLWNTINEENPHRSSEENQKSNPRIHLLKESELKKFYHSLVPVTIYKNDNLKEHNNYGADESLFNNIKPKSEQDYLNLDDKNQNRQTESEEQVYIPIQFYKTSDKSGKNLPVNTVWYRKDDIKQNHDGPLDSPYYSPLSYKEQLNYSYSKKDVPTSSKWYKSNQLKHESYRDRNPTILEHYR